MALSAADILKSKEFTEAHAKAQKHVKHEFQDYAYRLAHKLGDLKHRAIYMRLAKDVPRALLEQAMGFATDFRDEPNKGRLFMWKLKQLRAEYDRKHAKQNFDHDFVMQRMAQTFDVLANSISAKDLAGDREILKKQIDEFAEKINSLASSKAKPKILSTLCRGGVIPQALALQDWKVSGLDISLKLTKHAKRNAPDASCIRKKSLLENAYKDEQFSGAWVQNLWELVPLESESKYALEFFRILSPGGFVRIEVPLVDDQPEIAQEWIEFEYQGEKYLRFQKHVQADKLIEQFTKVGFTLDTVSDGMGDKGVFYFTK